MKSLKAAAVQLNHAPGDKDANLRKIDTFTARAAADGVELLVFPEMCITGYWHVRHLDHAQVEALAEPVPDGPSTDHLVGLARDHGLTLGAGLIERGDDGTLYNTYVVALPDGHTVRHRKLHCFISAHMASGNEFTVFDLPRGVRAGILTCYDCNLGENVRITALRGAQVLLAPHQTGGCTSKNPHIMGRVERDLWDNRANDPAAIEAELRGPKGREWLLRWLPTRAHDNGMFVVFSNGVGPDDDEVRTGNSMIIDPYGRILSETWKAAEDMVTADLDLSLLEHSTGRRWIKTRRPELYGELAAPTGQEVDTRTVRFDEKGV
ncbi:MAG: nitrilase family protein [Acidobacteria bacterium]|jgi:predicted amidohydrolase|nr:nitrilase family protein [Acidobacteriota bacterium]